MSNDKSFQLKLVAFIAIPLIMAIIPPPGGLSKYAWQLFGLYLGAIAGLVLRPFSAPVVLLIMIGASTVFLKNTAHVLSGFASGTAWLVFSAVMMSVAFIETGLGKRIAYILIGKMGKTVLGLGYATTFLELILAPGIPSNAARDGGIIYPITKSISVSLGSEPGATAHKAGAYLSQMLYLISCIGSYIFMTGCAPNILVAQFASSIMHVNIDWMLWFKAAFLPGMIAIAVTPYFLYKLYPPTVKELDNKKIAAEGLAVLGPMSFREKALSLFFILAIIGWMTESLTKIDATAVALGVTGGCLLLRIITWENIVKTADAWSTLIWYGGIIGFANALSKEKFFDWVATLLRKNVDFSGYDPTAILVVLVFFSIIVRYFFASGAAYTVSMVPVFFTIGTVANVPPMPLALGIAFSLSYASSLTHYGMAAAPIIFSGGYVEQGTWWKYGAVFAAFNFVLNMTVGSFYLKLLGLW